MILITSTIIIMLISIMIIIILIMIMISIMISIMIIKMTIRIMITIIMIIASPALWSASSASSSWRGRDRETGRQGDITVDMPIIMHTHAHMLVFYTCVHVSSLRTPHARYRAHVVTAPADAPPPPRRAAQPSDGMLMVVVHGEWPWSWSGYGLAWLGMARLGLAWHCMTWQGQEWLGVAGRGGAGGRVSASSARARGGGAPPSSLLCVLLVGCFPYVCFMFFVKLTNNQEL